MNYWNFVVLCSIMTAVALTSDNPVKHHIQKLAEIETLHRFQTDFLPEKELKALLHTISRTNNVDEAVNQIMDQVLKKLNNLTITSGFDPTPLENQGHEWKFKLFLITYKAKITLENGLLHGLATLRRFKSCTVSSDAKKITVAMPLTFTNLSFNYEYEAKLMNLGPKGGVHGKISDLKFTAAINIDIETLQAELESYTFETGKISLTLSGQHLLDWILNMFIEELIPFLSPILGNFISSSILDGIKHGIALYNKSICTFVGTC